MRADDGALAVAQDIHHARELTGRDARRHVVEGVLGARVGQPVAGRASAAGLADRGLVEPVRPHGGGQEGLDLGRARASSCCRALDLNQEGSSPSRTVTERRWPRESRTTSGTDCPGRSSGEHGGEILCRQRRLLVDGDDPIAGAQARLRRGGALVHRGDQYAADAEAARDTHAQVGAAGVCDVPALDQLVGDPPDGVGRDREADPGAGAPPASGFTAASVGIPTTRPSRSASAPPELPGLIGALVWTADERRRRPDPR